MIVQGFMDFTSESCTNNFAKTSKLGTKFLYFQQPSCSQAQMEQAELQEKGIPEGLPIYNYKGEKVYRKNNLKRAKSMGFCYIDN